MKNIVEVLAPAGSVMGLQASFKAGADAVYMGGKSFGARAYAENPDNEELIRAIDYAHVRGKNLYLTVNTLVKESEFEALFNYLSLLYREGLDAVIVQDLGVLDFIMENFKGLPIHISTQAGVTEGSLSRYYNEQVTRIVPARELTLEEIRQLKKETGREIEVFVHGALCYSYSGQCLLSSMCGDRSGNRGRCAQPCRKPMDASYVLSPKDICTLDRLPELIEAGVDSFKIEGRMKSVAYAAGVSEAYVWAARLYEKYGREGYYDYIRTHADEWKRRKLRLYDLFNRGGFSEGYAFSDTGRAMMSIKRPNHEGVKVGEAAIKNGIAECRLSEDIYKGDVLELRNEKLVNPYSYTSPEDIKGGGRLSFRALKKGKEKYANGLTSELFRYRCERLFDELEEKYVKPEDRLTVKGYLRAITGSRLELSLKTAEPNSINGKTYEITYIGGEVLQARNAPVTEQSLREKIERTSGQGFEFESLEIKISQDAFIPKSYMGELRREAFAMLEKEITGDFKRPEAIVNEVTAPTFNRAGNDIYNICQENLPAKNNKPVDKADERLTKEGKCDECINGNKNASRRIKTLVRTTKQLKTALDCDFVDGIILQLDSDELSGLITSKPSGIPSNTLPDSDESSDGSLSAMEALLKSIKNSGKKVFIKTFKIADKTNIGRVERIAKELYYLIDGFYVCNLSFAAALSEINEKIQKRSISADIQQLDESGSHKIKLYADKCLYVFNSHAIKMLEQIGFEGFIFPAELTCSEMTSLINAYKPDIKGTDSVSQLSTEGNESSNQLNMETELCIYGREELMVSKQCIKKTLGRCNHTPEFFTIKSEDGSEYPVYSSCSQCRNIIFDGSKLNLLKLQSEIEELGPASLIITFTDELGEEAGGVLKEAVRSGLITMEKSGIHSETEVRPVAQNKKSYDKNKNYTTGHFYSPVR